MDIIWEPIFTIASYDISFMDLIVFNFELADIAIFQVIARQLRFNLS